MAEEAVSPDEAAGKLSARMAEAARLNSLLEQAREGEFRVDATTVRFQLSSHGDSARLWVDGSRESATIRWLAGGYSVKVSGDVVGKTPEGDEKVDYYERSEGFMHGAGAFEKAVKFGLDALTGKAVEGVGAGL